MLLQLTFPTLNQCFQLKVIPLLWFWVKTRVACFCRRTCRFTSRRSSPPSLSPAPAALRSCVTSSGRCDTWPANASQVCPPVCVLSCLIHPRFVKKHLRSSSSPPQPTPTSSTRPSAASCSCDSSPSPSSRRTPSSCVHTIL